MSDDHAQDWLDAEADHHNDLEQHHAQRDDFATRLAATGEGLAKAGKEIADMKAAMEDVARRMEALDRAAMAPDMVRRATLNKVWDTLIDAGNISGAQLVMKMIGEASAAEAWSKGGA